VVEVGSAIIGVEDSAGVELESQGVGFNGDWDGTLSNGLLEGLGWVRFNSYITITSCGHDSLGFVVSASSIPGGVAVIGFELHTEVMSV
jgi:hypothetical protein